MQSLLVFLLMRSALLAGAFEGRVVGVSDGDTISVVRDGVSVPVRLYGIDAPERGQPFGLAAQRILSDLCFNKAVLVNIRTLDRWKRIVAEVSLPDGRSVNHEVLKAGGAWWLRRSCKDPHYQRIETAAREGKVGLWRDAHPIEPWEWRKGRSPDRSHSIHSYLE